MSEILQFQNVVQEAAQMLMVLDSGESLSTQQQSDALQVVNQLLISWWNEQTQSLNLLIVEQTKAAQVFIDSQIRVAAPLVDAFVLASGAYTPPSYTPSIFAATAAPQFLNTSGSITLPNGYGRALTLALAVELAPEYMMEPSPSLMRNLAEARNNAVPVPGRITIPGSAVTIPAPGVPPQPAGPAGEQ